MPNRIIRDAILSSEKMATLAWPEEVFYRRLMSIVDDYGRYEANPQLLRARCYPLQTDAVRVADISRWMAACQKAGLILDYAVQGKRYLEITNFQQQQRSASKYPAPLASDINCQQTPSNEHLVVSVVGVEGVIGDVIEGVSEKARAPVFVLPDWINAKHWDTWHSTPKRKKATADQKQMAVDKLDEWRLAGLDYAGALENAAIGGNQGLFLPNGNRAQPINKQQALEDRNKEVGRRWAEASHAGH